ESELHFERLGFVVQGAVCLNGKVLMAAQQAYGFSEISAEISGRKANQPQTARKRFLLPAGKLASAKIAPRGVHAAAA
ncbi:MAG: hypothetical protein II920_04205, partial [Clostridia bacterium]|nr:hypothetical protein [Clostridia bacterium]